jgi:penicillin-insensitive murein endopeptidase
MSRVVCALLLLPLLGVLACAGPNLWTDHTSVSTGEIHDGRVRQPAKLHTRGVGYKVPDRWRFRGFLFGTDELVAALQHAAARVRARHWAATAGFADLSPELGGPSKWHKSHQAGRDADVLFYTKLANGKLLPPPEHDMILFNGEGRSYLPETWEEGYADPKWKERHFDTRRNWQLIEALLSDPTIRVQWLFISRPLKALVLAEARRRGRPEWIVSYAETVMQQPGDSLPHDDHLHVRIYCSRADRFHGCKDVGPVWQHEKKAYKYNGPERYDPVLWRQLAAMTGPLGG